MLGVVAEVAAQGVAEDHDAVVSVVAGGAVALVEAIGAGPAAAVGDHDGDVRQCVSQQVGQVVERVADELLEVLVIERVEVHEVGFVGVDREAFAGELLGVAHDLFELALRLRVAPAGHAHGDERHAAHQHRGDDHAERDVLQRPHGADRAEALPDARARPGRATMRPAPRSRRGAGYRPPLTRATSTPPAAGQKPHKRMMPKPGPHQRGPTARRPSNVTKLRIISACARSRRAGSRSCPRRSG